MALASLVAFSFLMVVWLASPIWVGLMLGTVMAFTAHPVFRRLVARLGEKHRALAAAVATGLGVVACAVGVLLLYVLVRQMFDFAGDVQAKLADGKLLASLTGSEGKAAHALAAIGVDPRTLASHAQEGLTALSAHAAQAAGLVLQTTSTALLTTVFTLLTMYYVMLEWPRLIAHLELLSPLEPRHTRALLLEIREVSRGVFLGTIGSAVVQGALAWIGFAIAGVPRALTFGLVTIFSSFIPVVGTVIVWLPAAIFLFMTGEPGRAVFMIAWGMLVVMATTDYVVRPLLVGRGGKTNTLLTLVALLGGIGVFGLPGILAGPLVMSFFLAILGIYERERPRDEA